MLQFRAVRYFGPLGWKWAAFVWGYAIFWFLINDQLKLLAYKVLNATKHGSATGPERRQATPAMPLASAARPAAMEA
jgi:H+-transporting ATPase